jgi:hypothetical protein
MSVQQMSLAVDSISIVGELAALCVFLLYPALISKAWNCTMLRANELSMRLTAVDDFTYADNYELFTQQGVKGDAAVNMSTVAADDASDKALPTTATAEGNTADVDGTAPVGVDDAVLPSPDVEHELDEMTSMMGTMYEEDDTDYISVMATWLYRMDFHFKYLDVGITTNFLTSLVYALISIAVITLRVVNQNPQPIQG